MTTSNLDRIREEVKALTPDEQRSLRDMVDELLAASAPQMTEDEFEQHLLRKGVISRIPPRIRDASFEANRKLIEVKGKPLSENYYRGAPLGVRTFLRRQRYHQAIR